MPHFEAKTRWERAERKEEDRAYSTKREEDGWRKVEWSNAMTEKERGVEGRSVLKRGE
jgi:hypothetical protein